MRKLNHVSVSSKHSVGIIPVENSTKKTATVSKGINYVLCIDVSYSMYNDLPALRKQIKNRLPNMLTNNDSISLIWFSGRGQAGYLKEKVQIESLMDLQKVHDAIDKFIKPVGATSFLDPIVLVNKLIDETVTDKDWALIFMTDGYNNSSSWSDINKSLEELAPKLSSSSYVEFGFYADSQKLEEMAELTGGVKIVSQSFDEYEAKIESVITNQPTGLVELDITDIKKDLAYQFVFSVAKDGVSITTYSTEKKNSIFVDSRAGEVYFIAEEKTPQTKTKSDDKLRLLAMKALFSKSKIDLAEQVLYHIGDVSLIDHYNNSYGKQNLNGFHNRVDDLIENEDARFENGRKAGYKPKDDAYCVLDLMSDLASSDDNLIYPMDSSFTYKRMSAKRVQKGTTALEEGDLSKKAAKKLADSMASFIPNEENPGAPISNFAWHSERANVSLLLKVDGIVKLPKNEFGMKTVDSYIWRNYNILKDGVLNFTQLPVKLNKATLKKIEGKVPYSIMTEGRVLLDLSALPTINKSYLEKVYAKEVANFEVNGLINKCTRKYIDYLLKSLKTPGRPSHDAKVAEYLKTIGISYDGSFSPLTEKTESKDIYIAPVLETKIEKFSSIPSIEAVYKKLNAKKALTLSESLLHSRMEYVDNKLSAAPKRDHKKILDNLYGKLHESVKADILAIAKNKFCLILSRKWFRDLNEDENLVTIDSGGNTFNVKFEWKDEEVKV